MQFVIKLLCIMSLAGVVSMYEYNRRVTPRNHYDYNRRVTTRNHYDYNNGGAPRNHNNNGGASRQYDHNRGGASRQYDHNRGGASRQYDHNRGGAPRQYDHNRGGASRQYDHNKGGAPKLDCRKDPCQCNYDQVPEDIQLNAHVNVRCDCWLEELYQECTGEMNEGDFGTAGRSMTSRQIANMKGWADQVQRMNTVRGQRMRKKSKSRHIYNPKTGGWYEVR